jgi:4-amino-4-deoxy-L-arabinose transferase-like glycosyltransferase
VDRVDQGVAPAGRLYLGPVVGLALVLRVVVVAMAATSHPAMWFFNQSSELAVLGESLRAGHGLSSPFGGGTGPSAFLTPGYPALVALAFAVFGSYSAGAETAMMVLQALFGAATVLVLMLLTRRLFGARAANLAGIVWAVSPPAVFLPTVFWESSLSVLLAVGLVGFAVWVVYRPQMWWLFGAVCGLAVMVNPALLLIGVGGFGWAVFRSGREALRGALVGAVVWVAVCTPWVIRNSVEMHAWIPLRSNLGYELWQGNRPGGDGFFEPRLHPNVNGEQAAELRRLGEVGYMHSRMVAAEGYIAAHPGLFVLLSLKRAYYFWIGVGRQSAPLIVAYIVGTSLLGFWGLGRLWRVERGLVVLFLGPILLFPFPYYLTHPDFRFRLVIDPMMTALAAYAVVGVLFPGAEARIFDGFGMSRLKPGPISGATATAEINTEILASPATVCFVKGERVMEKAKNGGACFSLSHNPDGDED